MPGEIPPVFNLGESLLALGRHDEAIEWLWRAARLAPVGPMSRHAWYNLGIAHWKSGRAEEALGFLDRALLADPNDSETRHNIAVISLACGHYERGWREYVRRLVVRRNRWPASPLPDRFDKPVYLRCEQGIGDVLFFARWIPALRDRGVTEIHCRYPRKIAAVMRRAFPDVIDGLGHEGCVDIFLGDLPFLTETPGPLPPVRLHAEPIHPFDYGQIHARPKRRIGVTWRAGSKFELGQWKETKPQHLAGLCVALDAVPVLLQRNASRDEKALFATAVDYCAECEDPEFVLDILPHLDAYVTVSNTNVHLAAGLAGKQPAMHVLVTHPPEPRWMVGGDSSPWFPGMTAYRMDHRGNWPADTFDRITEALWR